MNIKDLMIKDAMIMDYKRLIKKAQLMKWSKNV